MIYDVHGVMYMSVPDIEPYLSQYNYFHASIQNFLRITDYN